MCWYFLVFEVMLSTHLSQLHYCPSSEEGPGPLRLLELFLLFLLGSLSQSEEDVLDKSRLGGSEMEIY